VLIFYSTLPGPSKSVSRRIAAETDLFARIAENLGNIPFGRAFLLTEVHSVEVSHHARRLE
jgi:hypothetical protein